MDPAFAGMARMINDFSAYQQPLVMQPLSAKLAIKHQYGIGQGLCAGSGLAGLY